MLDSIVIGSTYDDIKAGVLQGITYLDEVEKCNPDRKAWCEMHRIDLRAILAKLEILKTMEQ